MVVCLSRGSLVLVLSRLFECTCILGRQTISDLERHLLSEFSSRKLSLDNVCAGVTDGGKNFVGATKNQLIDHEKDQVIKSCFVCMTLCRQKCSVFMLFAFVID